MLIMLPIWSLYSKKRSEIFLIRRLPRYLNPGSPRVFLSEGVRYFRITGGNLSPSHDRSAQGRIRSYGEAGAYFEGFEIPQVLGSCPACRASTARPFSLPVGPLELFSAPWSESNPDRQPEREHECSHQPDIRKERSQPVGTTREG